MRTLRRLLDDRRGAVLMVSTIVLLAVMVLGIGMLTNSNFNATMARNGKEKIKSFCAADGVMTKLAQEVISGRGTLYTQNPGFTGVDMGGAAPAGRDTSVMDTFWVSGGGAGGIGGSSDQCHFAYAAVKGNVDISLRVDSLVDSSGASAAKMVGIMVRQDLTGNGRRVFWGVGNTSAMRQYRTVPSGADNVHDWSTHARVGVNGIRLQREHHMFTIYVDQGLGWKKLESFSFTGADTIPSQPQYYVGIAVASGGSGVTSRACVRLLRGVPCVSTVAMGDTTKGGYTVRSQVVRRWDGGYEIGCEAFRMSGGGAVFSTVLNQIVSAEIAGGYRAMVEDSLYVPVTFYDFHANGSNPEFQINGGPGNVTKGMVKTRGLDSWRKPIPILSTGGNPGYRNCLLTTNNCWGQIGPNGTQPRINDWWGFFVCCLRSRSYICTNAWWACGTCTANFPADGCQAQYPNPTDQNWFFSDHVDKWFRPYGAPAATFDTLTGRWDGLAYDGTLNAWVGANRADSLAAAASAGQRTFDNCIMYDSLVFVRNTTYNPHDSNTYVFGLTCDPTRYTFCDSLATPWGEMRHWGDFFHPLSGRGFGYDGPFDSVDGTGMGWFVKHDAPTHCVKYADMGAFKNQNYAFTMEIHRKFVADTGEIFVFKGNDDLWVFMNDSLVMDEGGVHGAYYDTVKVGNLIAGGFLVRGNEYWFDAFYSERNGWGSEILIATNIMWFDPGRAIQRRWKRDYGNTD